MDEQRMEKITIPFDQEVLFTISEASQLLKVNRGKVYELIDQGLIRVTKLGRRKITRKALMDFIEKYDGCDIDSMLENPPDQEGRPKAIEVPSSIVLSPAELRRREKLQSR